MRLRVRHVSETFYTKECPLLGNLCHKYRFGGRRRTVCDRTCFWFPDLREIAASWSTIDWRGAELP